MKNLNIKDLSIIGVLSTLAFICNSLVATFVTPLLGDIGIYAHVGPSLLLAGIIFVVVLKKVAKPGCFFLFGVVFSILFSLMGLWQMSFVIIPATLIGELILAGNGYHSNLRIVIAYTVYGGIYSLHPGFFVWILGQSGLMSQFPEIFTEADAIAHVAKYTNTAFVSKILIFTSLFACAGGILGVMLYQKFFTENNKTSVLDQI
ncbi:MptD family putative ECF transporter S component [Acinetobacter rudis]|uniref:Uncharacterized protein n=1 Tax=Acinetobacter rudis CIP 110305 TaxID=421052 RepID=S3NAV6_9GAMM|nr:MptD family putative ECF transporter S component [Acinetobacter rudis]EPF75578.1 hypothetical protein F945_01243 [Acinetobacter rudis CIP 110305]